MRDYMGAGLVFHLFSRTIYGQIEKDNLRNRRQHSFDFIRTRLVLLDFILANQDLAYFETEQDKVSFFCEQLEISKDLLPAKVYEGASRQPSNDSLFCGQISALPCPSSLRGSPCGHSELCGFGVRNAFQFHLLTLRPIRGSSDN